MASLLRFLVLALALLAVPAQAEKRIAISFDDVPRHAGGFKTPDERAIALIAALAAAIARGLVAPPPVPATGPRDRREAVAEIAQFLERCAARARASQPLSRSAAV